MPIEVIHSPSFRKQRSIGANQCRKLLLNTLSTQAQLTEVHFYSLIVILKGTWQILQDVLYKKANGSNWRKLGVVHEWTSEGSLALIFFYSLL